MIWLRYMGVSIWGTDENARIWVIPVDRCPKQLRNDRIRDGSVANQTNGLVGRYVATDFLRIGCYVATDSLRIGRYVATDQEVVRMKF